MNNVDFYPRPKKPAEAVRGMLELLSKQEQHLQAQLVLAQESARQAADAAAGAQADLDEVRVAIVEWRDFQRQHCE
jgi:hypothetical protein